MGLLAEYALTPDVFDMSCYSNEDVCDLRLQAIKDVLLNAGLVRNMRDGQWARLFLEEYRPWHRRGKELLRKLVLQKRLVPHAPALADSPITDADWCEEALATHRVTALSGIIISNAIEEKYRSNRMVVSIEKLTGTAWWTGQSTSMRLLRNLENYKEALRLVLRHANSIMFIDPHIDLELQRYKDFIPLLQCAGGRSPRPQIEIHRVCYKGSGVNRQILDLDELEASFRDTLTQAIETSGLSVEIYIWDDFHDRYVISNLIGISVPNGFDTTSAPNSITTWTRLGRNDRDDIQREFDPASKRHKLKRQFMIPK